MLATRFYSKPMMCNNHTQRRQSGDQICQYISVGLKVKPSNSIHISRQSGNETCEYTSLIRIWGGGTGGAYRTCGTGGAGYITVPPAAG
jgi:hypothetical protein